MITDHNERVNAFLASKGLTTESASQLSLEVKKGLDAEFREQRRADFAAYFGDESARKLSRAALKALLPVGAPLTLVFCMGSLVEKPRTVAAHKSYGFEMAVPDKPQTSSLRFGAGESVWISGNIITIREGNGDVIVRYRLPEVL